MRKHWITLSIVAVVIISAVTAAFFLSRPQGNAVMESIKMTASKLTEQGVETDSSFALTGGYRLKEQELREILAVEPPMEYTLTGGGKRWTISPKEPLEKNSVYTFRIKSYAGDVVQSFAFQTKSDLLVDRVYPADEQTMVPVEAGIEMTLNATGAEVQDYFEIKPQTAGTFEVRDYTVVFQPSQPLAEDSIYRITLKQGLTAPNGMTLTEDYSFSFTTSSAQSEKWDYTKLRLSGEFAETFLPGDTLAVEMSSGSRLEGQSFHIQLHRFPQIDSYIEQVKAHDTYYKERYGKKADYIVDTAGLEEVAAFDSELFSKDEYWGNIYAILPADLPQGHYVATISGKNQEGAEQFVQKLLQITNLSVYTQSTDGDTLLWLNDPISGNPMIDTALRLTDTEAKEKVQQLTTQTDGTVRVMTRDTERAYLEVLTNGEVSYFDLLSLSPVKDVRLAEKYYAAIYTDREIYQPSDTIRLWGVIRPRRVTDSLPPTAYAVLTGNSEAEIYRVKLNINPDGTFEGEMPISGMRKSWYTLKITDGADGVYLDKGLSIDEYTKPPYVIEVKTDKPYYYANEVIRLQLSAAFFDGTPVAGGSLRAEGWGLTPQNGSSVVSLDAQGKGSISMLYTPDSKDRLPHWEPQSIWCTVSNVDAEDVYINMSERITVLPSSVAIKAESKQEDTLTIHTAQLDPSKLTQGASARPLMIYDSEFDRLRGAAVDLPITIKVTKHESVQIPTGSYYDHVNKETVNKYRVERRESVVDVLHTKTAGGSVTLSELPYQPTENSFYSFEIQAAGGILGNVQEQYRPYNRGYGGQDSERTVYRLHPSGASRARYDVGEQIPVALYKNDKKIENQGRGLYTVTQRQTLATGIFSEDEISLSMQEDFVPNFMLAGAYFDGRHVYSIEPSNLCYQYEGKRLKITAAADSASYRPGDKAAVSLSVTDAQGKPVAASAVIGIVDESVFSLAQQRVALADQLYANIFHPNLHQSASYVEYALNKAEPQAGGMGGGGGDSAPLRQEFVDTALFETVKTDANGKATVTLTLPDNVTEWRITAAAVTDDLKAGDSVGSAVTTLPYYIRPLFTDSYLEGDDIALVIDSVGTEVKPGEKADYTVTVSDASGVELDRLTASGKVGERTPVNLGKYAAGNYSMTVTGASGAYSDAVKHSFSVVKQALTVPVLKNMPLSEVNSVRSVRYPVQLVIYDERMQPFMQTLQKLSAQDGERTEILAASYRARVIYNELLPLEERQNIRRDSRLDEIQSEEGGAKLLPLSQADAGVTAKLLVAAPELLDPQRAGQYLQTVLKNPAAVQEDRVMAYMGLAALKKPILLDITRMVEQETLTTAQKLYLGIGLAKLGDFTGAQKIYDSLGSRLVSEGKLKYVEVEGSTEERLQATAAALMLTSCIANPDADALARYFNELDVDRSRSSEVLYNLEMLTYVTQFTPPQGGEAARLRYLADGQPQELALDETGVKTLSMGLEAMQNPAFETLSGKLFAAVSYTDYAHQTQTAPNTKVTLEKTYTPALSEVKAGEAVRVDLTVRFAQDAPYGSYQISDYIPSGMRYLPNHGRESTPYLPYCRATVENEGQRVFGTIYRNKPEEESFAVKGGNPDILVGAEQESGTYTISYYVSMAIPGEFISESAYLTPYETGVSAKSERVTVKIQ